MMRPWHVGVLFGVCLAVVFAAVGWISLTALGLERDAHQQATQEENVRLALWRIDSTLRPFLNQEDSRPYFVYRAFYPAERAYTRMFSPIEYGEVLVPSPLLTDVSPFVRLYFQLGPDGVLTSPQVPQNKLPEEVVAGYAPRERLAQARERLALLEGLLNPPALRTALGCDLPLAAAPAPVVAWEPNANVAPSNQTGSPPPQAALNPQQAVQLKNTKQVVGQQARNDIEQQARVQQAHMQKQTQQWEAPANMGAGLCADALTPLWLDGQLLLARRVAVNNEQYIQGCWLDWDEIQRQVLAAIAGLFPNAQLKPAPPDAPGNDSRRLTMLPAVLVPGESAVELAQADSPTRLTLWIAWGGLVLAALAVGALLTGLLSLSERRAAFVSAVTHELRTPLTTFRLYTDLLAAGGALDADQRQTYLETLRREAERLGHLIENVLAYARLERGRAAQAEKIALGHLLDRVLPHLKDRAAQARLELKTHIAEQAAASVLRVDAAAVERILVNLVDNACKYAAEGTEPAVHLEARLDADSAPRAVFLYVRDHGPGFTRAEARRLFRPFRKARRNSAALAAGVGLGLALSRRLAHGMGGDLRLDDRIHDGACFLLTLPLVAQTAERSPKR